MNDHLYKTFEGKVCYIEAKKEKLAEDEGYENG